MVTRFMARLRMMNWNDNCNQNRDIHVYVLHFAQVQVEKIQLGLEIHLGLKKLFKFPLKIDLSMKR